MKIVCIGHAAYDITIPMDDFPKENTKNRVNARMECGGGPASNAAYLLGKWGAEVYFLGVVGNDEYGKTIKKEFEDVNVSTKFLQLSDNYNTTSSFIIANVSSGSRTILTYRPSEMSMDEVDLGFEPEMILLDGQEYKFSKKLLDKYNNAISVIDAGRYNDNNLELAKMCKHVVCSMEFAEEATGLKFDFDNLSSLTKIYNKLNKIFDGNVVVTLESKGSLYGYKDKAKLMTPLNVKALDSTGAGDIFHGAYTYCLSKKMDFEDVIKVSNIAGALSVLKIGGRYSMPSKKEIREYYSELK